MHRLIRVRQAITSNEALELQELPKHAIIVGAGYIGTTIALESPFLSSEMLTTVSP